MRITGKGGMRRETLRKPVFYKGKRHFQVGTKLKFLSYLDFRGIGIERCPFLMP